MSIVERFINTMSLSWRRVQYWRFHIKKHSFSPPSSSLSLFLSQGYNSVKEFIATQGPLPHTTNDFWRMVWEQDTRIIVMVTNLVENGMVKSHDYWPTRSSLVYGAVCVTLQSVKLYPDFVVRTFDITSIQKNKKVCSCVCV